MHSGASSAATRAAARTATPRWSSSTPGAVYMSSRFVTTTPAPPIGGCSTAEPREPSHAARLHHEPHRPQRSHPRKAVMTHDHDPDPLQAALDALGPLEPGRRINPEAVIELL